MFREQEKEEESTKETRREQLERGAFWVVDTHSCCQMAYSMLRVNFNS